jgi:DNA-binding PadR family transcriptional regulator
MCSLHWTVQSGLSRENVTERLNSTAGAVLGLLRAGPRSGYDLVSDAQEVVGGFWTVTRSQVYRELGDLAERGLVEPGQRGPRDRRPFELTDRGREAFREWVNTPPEPENLRIPLLLRLTFADEIDPARLHQTLSEHRDLHARRLEEYHQLDGQLTAGGVPIEARVTLAYGISYESAVLRWFEELPDSLTRRPARSRGSADNAAVTPGPASRRRRGHNRRS